MYSNDNTLKLSTEALRASNEETFSFIYLKKCLESQKYVQIPAHHQQHLILDDSKVSACFLGGNER